MDPRQGGGGFSMAAMIVKMVVSMLHKFYIMARWVGEDKMLGSRSGSVSELMEHNLNVADIMVPTVRFTVLRCSLIVLSVQRKEKTTPGEEANILELVLIMLQTIKEDRNTTQND